MVNYSSPGNQIIYEFRMPDSCLLWYLHNPTQKYKGASIPVLVKSVNFFLDFLLFFTYPCI